jgi:hypothetical protein
METALVLHLDDHGTEIFGVVNRGNSIHAHLVRSWTHGGDLEERVGLRSNMNVVEDVLRICRSSLETQQDGNISVNDTTAEHGILRLELEHVATLSVHLKSSNGLR